MKTRSTYRFLLYHIEFAWQNDSADVIKVDGNEFKPDL